MHEILSMRVENFLSFKEADFDFEATGLVLVEGRNGAGKSGMVDGILWCLFGETLRGYKHDKVVNRRVGEGCAVTVRLRTGDEEWGVTRARSHKKLKNSLTLDAPGFVQAGDKDVQAEIERRLGCSYKTFLSSVVFGQDRAYRFSSLTDAEQKVILDEVLGVERFAQACAVARKQLSSLQADLETNRRAIDKNTKARDEAEADAVDLKVKDVDFAKVQRKKVEAEREKLRAVKEELNKTRKVHDVAALKAASSAALRALAECEKKADKWSDMGSQAQAAVAGGKAKLDEAVAELRHHQKDPGRCPACGQEVTKKIGAASVSALRERIDKLKEEHTGWIRIAGEAAATSASARQEVKAARQAVTDAQRAIERGVEHEAEAASLRRRRVDHEARIAELEAEENPYAALAAKARSRYTQLAADVDQLAAYIEGDEAKLRRAEFWVKAYGASGLRSLLVDSSLPLLNQEAARVSRALTGGAVKIEFSATSEQKSGKIVDRFEVKVDNEDGAGDYAGNSAGERAKVDLCVGLALQRLVASRSPAAFNIAVFDEVFDHLDTASHEPVIEVLSELEKESVFVVSHDEDLKAWFPATLRLVKRGGFSTVDV